jgi:disulfide bond formation protein DsbB
LRNAAPFARWLALALPAALLGGAYVAQYGFDLFPCRMCWWQRYGHFAAIGLAILGIATRRVSLTWLAVGALAVAGLIGAFHAGVEYHWWAGPATCTSAVQAGGDPLDAIMNAPVVRCDVAPWTLLGISLAGFNFLISCGGALVLAVMLRRRGKA